MKIKHKKIIIILLILLDLLVAVVGIYKVYTTTKEKNKINEVLNIYSNENVQNTIENSTNSTSKNILDLTTEIDGKKIIGIIKIDKINFEGLIYEGTDLSTLKLGVGHFKSSPYLDGNVCLAAHNTSNLWENLKDLNYGDIIKYTSFLGTREYKVYNIQQIEETDFSLLSNTDYNIITLITCVKNNKSKRLCVQATEVK